MNIKRSWTEFKSIVTAKTLQIFEGELRADYYHLLAIDGQLTYESIIQKNGLADQLEFEADYLPSITNRISQEPDWDDFLTTFPTSISELHTYKKNEVIVQTVLVTYQTAAKSQIIRIQKTRV